MNFEQAVTFLYSRESLGWKLDLSRITHLLAAIDNPQHHLKGIHIAGTNGKGSVAAMLESIFKLNGYRTGLYTSPHLYDPRERIRINRKIIDKKHFVKSVQKLKPFIIETGATFFESMTAMAFDTFAASSIEWVILETGLGGRFDATNVFTPDLSIITSIQFDHMQYLGNSIKSIAYEKAGIVKPGIPCVLGIVPRSAQDVIAKRCFELDSVLIKSRSWARVCDVTLSPHQSSFTIQKGNRKESYICNLVGMHQIQNARVALAAVEQLKSKGVELQRVSVHEGLSKVEWPGRFQVVRKNPLIIFDVAHNPSGIRRLVHTIQRTVSRPVIYIVGFMGDKDVPSILKLLKSALEIHMVPLDTSRAMTIESMEKLKSRFPHLPIYVHRKEADKVIRNLMAMRRDAMICVTGSHYLASFIQKAKRA